MSNLPVGNSPTRDNPYSSELLVNRLLTSGSGKETRHFELSLKNSGLDYTPGDSLGIKPQNCSIVVKKLLDAAGLNGEEIVQVGEESLLVLEALKSRLACTVLSKIQVKKFNEIAQSESLSNLLQLSNKDALVEYMWGRELLDLFLEFPQQGLKAQELIDLLRPMPPRLYSIASSLAAHSEEVHLTVAVVRYEGQGMKKKGVCSTYLAERVGDSISCYLHPNKNFKLPADHSVPIIMVGPGTGIAPFRSFIEERKATGANGKNWLFFGERNQKTSYLYGDEWEAYHKDGILNQLDLAWSREQKEKVYVQHKMMERKFDLWNWLQAGAVFYVCGDASRMAKDVDQALRLIAQDQGAMSEEEAAVWIRSLQKERRYLKDIY